jgi:aminoglycoside phosphotransferase (APT) family kinase protein
MSEQWTAELKIEPVHAQRMIEEQFPDLSPVVLEPVGEGWDNVVYRVNRNYVFRFPRRQLGADLVAVEMQMLPNLCHRLSLPIPEPLFFGKPTEEYRWPFLGYHFLEGKSAGSRRLSIAQRMKLAVPLGQFLKSLHAISEEEALMLGAQPDNLGKLDVPFRRQQTEENLAKIKELGLFDDCDTLLAILNDLKDVRDVGPKSLVHGDLYARHLLVDEQGALSGVIDWGDVHIGNPAVDLKILFDFLPKEARQQFIEAYGPINKNTLQLALFRALCHTAICLLYGHDVGDKDLVAECLFGLKLIAQASF